MDGPDKFTVNLCEMRNASRRTLPTTAGFYVDAANSVHGTRWYDGTLFRGDCPVQSVWSEFRDRLQLVLGQTAANLYATAVAVDMALDAYAQTDDQARTDLDRYRIKNSLPERVDLSAVRVARRPQDPVPATLRDIIEVPGRTR